MAASHITDIAPSLYVIVAEGDLRPQVGERFSGMHVRTVSHTNGAEAGSSQLIGWLPDFDALHEVLTALELRAMPIVSVQRIDADEISASR
jgi:hypothetical protein